MKQSILLCLLCLSLCGLCAGCAAAPPADVPETTDALSTLDKVEETTQTETMTEMKLIIEIGDKTFTATPSDTDAARTFAERLLEGSLTFKLSDYAGFEKVGALGFSLPAEDRHITTSPGDIVLYQGNQIVMFYGSNTWAYTPLATLDDRTGWEEALGNGNVTAVFSVRSK